MNIVAIGRSDILYNSIIEIERSGYNISAIITSQSNQYQYRRDINHFTKLSKRLKCKLFITDDLKDKHVVHYLEEIKPDLGISVNWMTLISQEIIDFFKNGILNAHAGDLPKFKGNAVRNWAIINGESEIALTIHKMDILLDSGPILIKERFKLNSETKIGELYDFVELRAPKMFVKAIKGISEGKESIQHSNREKSLRCYPRLPIDSEIDWTSSAEEINRLVRASSEPFTGAYSFIDGEKITIWDSAIGDNSEDYLASPGQVLLRNKKQGILVATGEGILIIRDAETKNLGRVKPFLIIKSIRKRLGMNSSSEISLIKERLNFLESKLSKD